MVNTRELYSLDDRPSLAVPDRVPPAFERRPAGRLERDLLMAIEISPEQRKEAIASIERYFRENMDEKIGNIAAGALLGFFLEELGPAVYNQAVADVQARLQARVMEVDIEIHEDEFTYWRKFDSAARKKK